MSRMVFFVESYTAGGADQVAKMLFERLNVKKMYLFFNRGLDPSILFKDALPANIVIKKYNLLTIYEVRQFIQKWHANKPVYGCLKFFGYLLRYPLFCVSILYFYLKFRDLELTHFFAHNGGYPGGECCQAANLAASFFKGVRRFHAFHSVPFQSPRIARSLEFFIDKKIDICTHMLCVSEASGNILKKVRNFSQDPICIHNGLFPKKKKEYTVNTGLKLLHVGYFDWNKNQEMLIDCMIKISQAGINDIYLTMVGKEVEKGILPRLQEKARSAGITNLVSFKDFQKDVDSLYHSHDILLLSSRVESLPIVILEAMSVGMPVVATDVGGVREQIVDKKNGYVVKIDDVDTMVRKIMLFYREPLKISKMGGESFKIFQNGFTATHMINNYHRILDL